MPCRSARILPQLYRIGLQGESCILDLSSAIWPSHFFHVGMLPQYIPECLLHVGLCKGFGSVHHNGCEVRFRRPKLSNGILDILVGLGCQVQNALHMGWAEYCAALVTAARMGDDMDGRTLVVHNGDVSYAE